MRISVMRCILYRYKDLVYKYEKHCLKIQFSTLYLVLMELQGVLIYATKLPTNSKSNLYITTASNLVSAELNILDMRLKYPSEFNKIDSEFSSNLLWTATPTELAELLVALDLSKCITQKNGNELEFSELIRMFEKTLNIKLGLPHDIKRNILRRKTRLTAFLDKLKGRF